ncbi:MAG: hypothetical protein AUH86_09075 [Acidobacteria bacterium 13_1_40CM_4_58_4]|nr:MAG: hypothetical protein AUH86_09075 [Acidobacteria bacterium 13_1_40CM_4_58_4]
MSGVGADFSLQGGNELGPTGVVFHGGGVGLGVSQNLALHVNDGGACPGRLSFLRNNIPQGVLAAVAVDAVGEHGRLLPEIALDFLAERALPGAADGKVEGHCGRRDHQREGRQQFEKNAIPHFGASKRYPAPRTVLR